MNQTIETILKRRSTRTFDSKMLKNEELDTIIKCGLYAPSAKDKQNWHLTVITNQQRIDEISQGVVDGLAKIGLEKDPGYHVFYHAPVVIVVSSKIEGYSEVNAGCLVENMAIAATSMNIGSCIIGQTKYLYKGKTIQEGNRLLRIPEGYEHDISICFGYPLEENEPTPRKEKIVDYIK